MQKLGHEQLVFCHDKHTGLNALIAIHNTTLGPALGGTRLWKYNNYEEAIIDSLRLSRGMTYKAAISGLNLGGGKAVIIADPSMKSEAFWRRYGKFVNSLHGKYITAEDVNTTAADMEFISMETEFVTGVPEYMGGSGDPSPFTAYGVFMGLKAAAKKAWGTDNLVGRRVLVQGAGHVGRRLIDHLVKEGAKVFVSDINEEKLRLITAGHAAVEVINNDAVFDQKVDIYSPCALGAVLNSESIEKLTCKVIAGAANNQLANEQADGRALMRKGILYAPDFLINAGGLINVSSELEGYNKNKVMGSVEKIYERTLEILNLSEKEDIPPQEAAMKIADERLANMAILKSRM